jgi:hypothetical protein
MNLYSLRLDYTDGACWYLWPRMAPYTPREASLSEAVCPEMGLRGPVDRYVEGRLRGRTDTFDTGC